MVNIHITEMKVQSIFSLYVEDVFKITNRKGITLIGPSEGFIKSDDVLINEDNNTRHFKVIGVEMIDFFDTKKSLTHNPAPIIDVEIDEAIELKGKRLRSIA